MLFLSTKIAAGNQFFLLLLLLFELFMYMHKYVCMCMFIYTLWSLLFSFLSRLQYYFTMSPLRFSLSLVGFLIHCTSVESSMHACLPASIFRFQISVQSMLACALSSLFLFFGIAMLWLLMTLPLYSASVHVREFVCLLCNLICN